MKLEFFLDQNRSKMNDIESDFVKDIFFPYVGERGLDYLKTQTSIEDSYFKKRRLDFTLDTKKYKYVIEIDGYTYHAEGAPCVSPDYFDALLMKQNDLILSGWKLIRFSYNQIKNDPALCIDVLRRAFKADPELNPIFAGSDRLEPNFAQRQALDSVEFYRQQGKSKGIVILPTGVGKTYFSAFDAKFFNSKTLFIVHRDTILKQAYDSFEDVWPEASRGFFDASNKDTSSDIIFASKDTLYRDNNLQLFDPNEFGYIIIDEAHHSAATTYKKIIDYFNPDFMLGMTATPDRQDKASILELFDYNVFYEMDQRDAIESGYLTGFKYYGLKDDIDYSKIKHNGRRYDIVDLGRKLNIEKRNKAILNKFNELCPDAKSLGFCVNIDHAETMAEYFRNNGIEARAIHSDKNRLSQSDRESYIEDFRNNIIQVLFTVDVFNEGADFPDVQALLFLRPTESKTIFTQQLGRGLRLSPYKEHVYVLDFIGNFKKANLIKEYLLGSSNTNTTNNDTNNSTSSTNKRFGDKEFLDYPLGCEVHFDESITDLFSSMDSETSEITKEDLINNYYDVKEIIKRKPSQADINNTEISKFKLSSYTNKKLFSSWGKFLKEIGESTEAGYHYPQGTHLGHIFYIIKSIGDKNLDIRLNEDTIYPIEGQSLSILGRQSRFKLWACMELGLILDDRDPSSTIDKTRYKTLTSSGKYLYTLLNKFVHDENFFAFSEETKTEVSWSMVNQPDYYNNFVRSLPNEEISILQDIFFKMDAVQHLLKFLFHSNQNKEIFNRKEDIYNKYFDTPFIKNYFEVNGIQQDSTEGASRRLPFIINILHSLNIVDFLNRSEIKLNKLPMLPCLFENNQSYIESVYKYYNSSILPDASICSELKVLFGKDFLTDSYFVKSLESK